MTPTQFWIYMFTIAMSPLIAVQVSEWLQRRKEARGRRLALFHTLMATRGARLALDHVKALNMIDLEYRTADRPSRTVLEACKAYLSHLNTRGPSHDVWFAKGDDLFFELLYVMAKALDYSLEKSDLRSTSYTPVAHGRIEEDNERIRTGLAELLEGKRILPVHTPAETPQPRT